MNDDTIENLTIPDPGIHPNKGFMIAMANSKRSAALGVWMVVAPLFFLFGVLMKYFFHVDLKVLNIMEEFFASMDRNPVMHWLSPVLFMIFPLVSVAMNAMAMMNVQWNAGQRQAVVTIKIRPVNLLLLLVSLAIVGVIGLYLITENMKG